MPSTRSSQKNTEMCEFVRDSQKKLHKSNLSGQWRWGKTHMRVYFFKSYVTFVRFGPPGWHGVQQGGGRGRVNPPPSIGSQRTSTEGRRIFERRHRVFS